MKQGLRPGFTRERSYAVTPEVGTKHLGPGVSPVLSTPAMISMMERTCSELLTSYLDEGEQTVGFHVDVKHLAPTRIGQTVTVTVTLQEVQERRFRFAVEAINDRGVKIGSGIHRRTLIRVKDFGQEPS